MGQDEDVAGSSIPMGDSLLYNTVDVSPREHNYMFGNLWDSRPSMQTVEMGRVGEALKQKLDTSGRFFQQKKRADGMKRFGTFDGVIVHCLLTIWGIMLFLRLGWMVAHAGLIQASIVIIISLLTTIVTALSLSAICTNGEVGAGGTYYLVSRSLGAPWGASIGLIFSLANAVAVALYVVGFSECVLHIAVECGAPAWLDDNVNAVRVVGLIVCASLLILCLIGVEWVVKLDMYQLLLLLFAIFWVVIGTFIKSPDPEIGFTGYRYETMMENMWSAYESDEPGESPQNFLTVFSVFFPAMTGMMAGANMSGDLKDPQKSIPKGTIISVLSSTFVYIALVWVLGSAFSRIDISDVHGMYRNQFMMADVSPWAGVVYAGILASTFSSALASMLGAPRILMAVCEDGVFPCLNYFSKGREKDNEPVRGYFLTFVIAVAFTMIGNINDIAPIITNFFLWNRTLINYACFAVAMSKAPGWRPSFKYYHPYLSLFGGLACVVLMLALSWWSAILDMILAYCLYRYVDKNRPDVNWGEATHGLTYVRAAQNLVKLQSLPMHAKNWRPSYLIVSQANSGDREELVLLTQQLKCGEGAVFDGKVIIGTFDEGIPGGESRRASFADVFDGDQDTVIAPSFVEGVQILLQTCGISGMRPNMLLQAFPSLEKCHSGERVRICNQFVQITRSALRCHLGVGVLRGHIEIPAPLPAKPTIDIWWLADTGGVALLLPHLLRMHRNWSHCSLRVFVHGCEDHFQEHEANMVRLMKLFRIDVALVKHIDLAGMPPDEAWGSFENVRQETASPHYSKMVHFLQLGHSIRKYSSDASLIFATLPYPRAKSFTSTQIVQWLEAASEGVTAPILFLRGNQKHVLTLKC